MHNQQICINFNFLVKYGQMFKVSKNSLFYIPVALVIVTLLSYNMYSILAPKINTNTYSNKIIGWGISKFNNLGPIKDRGNVHSNNAIMQEIPKGIKDLSIGYGFYSIIDYAGMVYTKGDNRAGQMGDGKQYIFQENLTKSSLSGETDNIDSNYTYSLALQKDGTVLGWGQNLTGQIGGQLHDRQLKPIVINGLKDISSIHAGYRSSYFINKNGKAYKLGGNCTVDEINSWRKLADNIAGNITLGGGYYDRQSQSIEDSRNINDCNEVSLEYMATNAKEVTEVTGLGDNKIVDIKGGYGHVLYLDSAGSVFSSGCNLYGQLGRNGKENNIISQTSGRVDFGGVKAVQIEAGFRHSLILDEQGIVYGSGHNEYGEMGNDSKQDNIGFKKIEGLPKIKQIIASYDYSLSLDYDGVLWGWGSNQFEQIIGEKDLKTVTTPTKIQLKDNARVQKVHSRGGFILAEIE